MGRRKVESKEWGSGCQSEQYLSMGIVLDNQMEMNKVLFRGVENYTDILNIHLLLLEIRY